MYPRLSVPLQSAGLAGHVEPLSTLIRIRDVRKDTVGKTQGYEEHGQRAHLPLPCASPGGCPKGGRLRAGVASGYEKWSVCLYHVPAGIAPIAASSYPFRE